MKQKRKWDAETAAALAELDGIRDRLSAVRSEFHHSADPMLVEANIHEMNALHARYGYLLRRLKELREAAPQKRGRRKRREQEP